MSTSGYPEAPAASDVAFDVERFEWTALDRLEVRGRWSGVRGRRVMRPSPNVDIAHRRRRLIAPLDHKPRAAPDRHARVGAVPRQGGRGRRRPGRPGGGPGASPVPPPPRA